MLQLLAYLAAYPTWFRVILLSLVAAIVILLVFFRPVTEITALDSIVRGNAWSAGMGYNAVFQAKAEGADTNDVNLPNLIGQAQPYLNNLGVSVNLEQEVSRPDYLQKHAIPLALAIRAQIEAKHGRVAGAVYQIGQHIGPTTGVLRRLIEDAAYVANVTHQGPQVENIAIVLSEPISVPGAVPEKLRAEWFALINTIKSGNANHQTVADLMDWRERVRDHLK